MAGHVGSTSVLHHLLRRFVDNFDPLRNQLYAACIILLHSTAQMQIFQLRESQWAEGLDQAVICLSVLETCGLSDPLAAQLHGQLHNLYLRIVEFPCRTQSMPVTSSASISWNENAYLVTSPPGADPRIVEVSVTLLNMISRPFDKLSGFQIKSERRPSSREIREMNLVEINNRTVSNAETSVFSPSSTTVHVNWAQGLEDWNFESTLPFRVDSQRKSSAPESEAVPPLDTTPRVSDDARTYETTKRIKSGQK